MEAITGGANFRCSLVRWSWPAAFSEGKEEMTLATSSSVISSSREISELQSGDMVESWWSGEPSDLKYLAQPSMMSVPS